MPRFEDYFETTAKGLHPFDSITDRVNEHLDGKFEMTAQEQEQERQLYKRELLGRLMGERLTPRQFELLSGEYRDSHEKCEYYNRRVNEIFLDNRDMIRLHNEKIESIRRGKVTSGEWREEESHEKIRELADEAIHHTPKRHRTKVDRQEIDAYLSAYHLLDNPERMLEREYHFDEGLGESLTEHCENLKKSFPGLKVLVRRDRDGFAIVRTKFAPEYKYNIDDMENYDEDAARTRMHETVEAIVNFIHPQKPEEIVEQVA